MYIGRLTQYKDKKYVTFEIDEELDLEQIRRYSTDGILKAGITFDDNRILSADQRKKIYALLGEIARWSVSEPEWIKAWMKFYFISESGEDDFSLSNCSMTTARLFINYLIEFCFEWNVPFKDKGLTLQDDIGKYLWLCIKYRKCALCGKPADYHHTQAIGLGRNRKEADHSQHELIALCREHHQNAHMVGWETFKQAHYVDGIKLTTQDIKEFGVK